MCSCSNFLFNGGLQRLWICPNNPANFLTVLEEHEGWHSSDSEFLRDVRDLVYVKFEETCGIEYVGKSTKHRIR